MLYFIIRVHNMMVWMETDATLARLRIDRQATNRNENINYAYIVMCAMVIKPWITFELILEAYATCNISFH